VVVDWSIVRGFDVPAWIWVIEGGHRMSLPSTLRMRMLL